jgi:hypothetical protein
MNVREKIPWAKFGFEGVLIIASILAAFSIEEWRQTRSNAEQERILLEALAEDFDQAVRSFEVIKRAHSTVAASGEQIIKFAEAGSVPETDRTEFENMVGMHFWRARYVPPMGTVETILGSGRIDLITNTQLVAELTRWSSVVDSLNVVEMEANDHFFDRINPYLAGRLNLKDLDKGYKQFYGELPFEQKPVDAYLLITDEEFINMIYTHWVLKTNALLQIEAVEKSLESIQTLIATELAD